MLTLLIAILLILIAVYFLYNKQQEQNQNDEDLSLIHGLKAIPKVPGGIPGIGHLLYIGDRPCEYFQKLSKTIGPIFTIQMGWRDFIIMNDYDNIYKSLKVQGDNFSGRWDNIFGKDLAHNCGIFFKEKHFWAEQRTFTLRVLRDFGFGKFQTEDVVRKEGEKLFRCINSSKDEYLYMNDLLSIATVNSISDFIMKKEYDYNDEKIIKLLKLIRVTAQAADINNLFVNLYPIFEQYPGLSKKLLATFNPNKIPQMINAVYDFVREIADEHRSRFSPSNECNDLIDAFLLEQHKAKESYVKDTTFIDWQLIRMITELFFAGFETTASTLSWSLLLISKFPQIQENMFKEVLEHIGLERLPNMNDKKSLNYIQAVMDEVFRVSSLVPLSVPHKVFNSTEVNGYFIPGNTVVLTNLFAVHFDETLWNRPLDFYPEHFLTHDGLYKPRAELMPFGIGKRQCLGESLARVEYFILLVMFVQKFQMELSAEENTLSLHDLLRGTNGVIRGPISHRIKFTERNQ